MHNGAQRCTTANIHTKPFQQIFSCRQRVPWVVAMTHIARVVCVESRARTGRESSGLSALSPVSLSNIRYNIIAYRPLYKTESNLSSPSSFYYQPMCTHTVRNRTAVYFILVSTVSIQTINMSAHIPHFQTLSAVHTIYKRRLTSDRTLPISTAS